MNNELANEAYALCLEIEKLPASEQQTKCSIMASNLRSRWAALRESANNNKETNQL